jgi:phosphocarrier protein
VYFCSKYAWKFVIVANGRRANARHFIAVLLLSASLGSSITIETSGPDEVEALAAVTRLISNGFGEG